MLAIIVAKYYTIVDHQHNINERMKYWLMIMNRIPEWDDVGEEYDEAEHVAVPRSTKALLKAASDLLEPNMYSAFQ